MPQDEEDTPKKTKAALKQDRSPWLTTPKPIKRLFDRFPLVTYPANELPQIKHIERSRNTLYIFALKGVGRSNLPSFNPSCLKWQTYLKLMDVDFVTVPSSNHASPTGSLPFVIPASSTTEASTLDTVTPISSNKLADWASQNGHVTKQESENMRYDIYMSLLDHRIRNGWLHTLYLVPANFNAVARRLYIEPSTSSSPVRYALSNTLQAAALAEILRSSTSPVVDIDALYRESDNAFSAVSELLGDNDWFFGEDMPGLLDAAVFAYTHLLLDELMGWKTAEEKLGEGLREGRWKNLVEHRRRIYEKCYQ
ncbi:MAG: hypothetical protein Q9179_006854 [Wetmoreana sp. 5 TL-2023]